MTALQWKSREYQVAYLQDILHEVSSPFHSQWYAQYECAHACIFFECWTFIKCKLPTRRNIFAIWVLSYLRFCYLDQHTILKTSGLLMALNATWTNKCKSSNCRSPFRIREIHDTYIADRIPKWRWKYKCFAKKCHSMGFFFFVLFSSRFHHLGDRIV